jgi:hypothetical protein
LREFLGLVLPEAPPDHSTILRTSRLIDLESMGERNESSSQQRLATTAEASLLCSPKLITRLGGDAPLNEQPRGRLLRVWSDGKPASSPHPLGSV